MKKSLLFTIAILLFATTVYAGLLENPNPSIESYSDLFINMGGKYITNMVTPARTLIIDLNDSTIREIIFCLDDGEQTFTRDELVQILRSIGNDDPIAVMFWFPNDLDATPYIRLEPMPMDIKEPYLMDYDKE